MSTEDRLSTDLSTIARPLCWTLIGAYAASMLLPLVVPAFAAWAFFVQIGLLTCFGLAHGSVRYGLTGMLVFLASMVVVVNVLENISIGTGFPFGNFHHTAASGPQIFNVPIITGFAYFSAGYVAWILASTLLGESDVETDRLSLLSTPIVAMFILTGWDACIDPIGGTVARNWVWEDGGGYYGVPISNYLGWMLTTWLAYQIFALYLSGATHRLRVGQRRAWWLMPAVQFLLMSLQYPLYYLTGLNTKVSDPSGQFWYTGDIFEGTAIVSLFTMMFVSVTCLLIVLRKSFRRH